MIGVVGPRVRDVVEDIFAVHAVTFRDGEQTLGTEGPLRVDVEALALASLHVAGQLWCEIRGQSRVPHIQLAEANGPGR